MREPPLKNMRQCRALVELTTEAVLISSLEGLYLEVNGSASKMLGYEPHELVGKSCRETVSPCEYNDEMQNLKTLRAGERLPAYRRTLVGKDGGEIPTEVTAALVCDEEGNPCYIHSIVRDISQRKKLELALVESERKFRLFFENDPAYSYILSPEGHILDINQSALKALEFTKEELIGTPLIGTIYSPSSRKKAEELFKGPETGKTKNEELNIITKKGNERKVFSRVDSVTTPKGDVVFSMLIQEDVTEKKKMVEKLFTICTLSNKMTLSLDFDQIISIALYLARVVIKLRTAGITLIDEEKNELYVAGSYNLDRRVDDLRFHMESEVGITAHVARTGEPYYCPDVSKDTLYLKVTPNIRSELAVPLKIGAKVLGVFDAESTECDAFSDSDFLLLSILASQTAGALQNYNLFKEVTDLKDFNENIVRNIEEGILIKDSKGYITYANKAFEDIIGYPREELVGRHWKELPPGELVSRIEDEIERAPKGIKRRYRSEIVRKDGERTSVAITAIPLFDKGVFRGVLSFFKDMENMKES